MAISRGGWVVIIVWLGVWIYLAVRAFGRGETTLAGVYLAVGAVFALLRMRRLSQ